MTSSRVAQVLRTGIVIGSTRPGRKAEGVAQWVYAQAKTRASRGDTAHYELVDLQTFQLPLLNEGVPPGFGKPYEHEHTRRWSDKVNSLDSFVMVTPEYNHSTSAALKNALDYLYREWNNKAVGFVGYGSMYGSRAVENLRLVAGELQMADVRAQVGLSLFTDWDKSGAFKPAGMHDKSLHAMLDQLQSWAGALRQVRENKAAKL